MREPHYLASGIDLASRWLERDDTAKDGFYADTDLVTRAGWISRVR